MKRTESVASPFIFKLLCNYFQMTYLHMKYKKMCYLKKLCFFFLLLSKLKYIFLNKLIINDVCSSSFLILNFRLIFYNTTPTIFVWVPFHEGHLILQLKLILISCLNYFIKTLSLALIFSQQLGLTIIFFPSSLEDING